MAPPTSPSTVQKTDIPFLPQNNTHARRTQKTRKHPLNAIAATRTPDEAPVIPHQTTAARRRGKDRPRAFRRPAPPAARRVGDDRARVDVEDGRRAGRRSRASASASNIARPALVRARQERSGTARLAQVAERQERPANGPAASATLVFRPYFRRHTGRRRGKLVAAPQVDDEAPPSTRHPRRAPPARAAIVQRQSTARLQRGAEAQSSRKGPRAHASARKPAEASPASAPARRPARRLSGKPRSRAARGTASRDRVSLPRHQRMTGGRRHAASPRVSSAAGDVSSHGRSCSGSPLGAGGLNQCSTRRSHDGASGAAQDVFLAVCAAILAL